MKIRTAQGGAEIKVKNRIFVKKADDMHRKMAMIGKQIELKDPNQDTDDLVYWLSKTPQERLQAVTMLIRQNMTMGQRMDKTCATQRPMKT